MVLQMRLPNNNPLLQRFFELVFELGADRCLVDGALVRLDYSSHLVSIPLAHEQEDRRGARRERLAHILDELLVDPGAEQLAYQRPEPSADSDSCDREDEHEQWA